MTADAAPTEPAAPLWSQALPTFETEFPAFFDDSAAKKKTVKIGIDRELVLARRAEKRRLLNLLHVGNAAAALNRLPVDGETFHVIAGGSWSGFSLILAALRLAPGCKINWLRIATLSYSRDNVKALGTLLDEGTVANVGFIYSTYFRNTCTDEAHQLHDTLEDRGQRAAALRMHAKITLIELDDGRAFTIEASANLRSARQIEQFTFTQDRALHDFQAAWIDHLLDRAAKEDPSVDGCVIPRRRKSPPIDSDTAAETPAETSPSPQRHAPRKKTKTNGAKKTGRKSRQAQTKRRGSKTPRSGSRPARLPAAPRRTRPA